MQNNIPEKDLQKIYNKIPTIKDNVIQLFYNDFLFNMHDLINESNYGVALVCLRDAYFRLDDSKIALRNAYIQRIWYQEFITDAPYEIESIIYSKFYLDYIPLLLYAMQEDIADFIVNFLNIKDDFQSWKKDPNNIAKLDDLRIISNAGKVGIYLKDQLPNDPMTKIILNLKNDNNWTKVIKYRNINLGTQYLIIVTSHIMKFYNLGPR